MRKEVSIEQPQFYIDLAFSRARKELSAARGKKKANKRKRGEGFFSMKREYADRITLFQNFFKEHFSEIIGAFPEVWKLSEFYKELTEITIGISNLRKALGALSWAVSKINELSAQYRVKVLSSEDSEEARRMMREFEGRLFSIVNQVGPSLETLRKAKEEIKNYPIIKDGLFTVAISGFPNVGKSTLLSKITTSKPKIANYPFTTRSLLLGYTNAFEIEGSDSDVQVIDTPGTLDRMDKMNSIEKQAYAAMKSAAHLIVYVFDPTLQYPLQLQERLLSRIRGFGKPVLTYVSKTDIKEDTIQHTSKEIVEKHSAITRPEELASEIRKAAQNHYKSMRLNKFGK